MSKHLTPALALPVLPAHAGQFDGKWAVDFPGAGLNHIAFTRRRQAVWSSAAIR